MPKKMITKIRYFYVTGKKLDLKDPKDFNEKVLYLMLNECDDKKKQCVDKYLARDLAIFMVSLLELDVT